MRSLTHYCKLSRLLNTVTSEGKPCGVTILPLEKHVQWQAEHQSAHDYVQTLCLSGSKSFTGYVHITFDTFSPYNTVSYPLACRIETTVDLSRDLRPGDAVCFVPDARKAIDPTFSVPSHT